MPITRSAKNALRQSQRRRTRNIKRKKQLTDALKTYRKHTAAGKKEEAAKSLAAVYKAADKLAKTGVIHRNRASRIKSRLAKKIK